MQRDVVVLSGDEGRHAATVRRLRPGERADLIDGAGMTAECVVTATRPGQLELTVLGRHEEPQPQPRICVVQAILKGDRGEQAVETMTEVGVDVIVPWAAERCVAVWGPAGGSGSGGALGGGVPGVPGVPGGGVPGVPGSGGGRAAGRRDGGRSSGARAGRSERGLARWRSTAREAAKQSRRARIPEVTAPAATADVLDRIAAAACAIVLDPAAGAGIGSLPLPDAGEIVLIVGPEGGVSPAESDAFAAAGAVAVRLGPTVLRASSAGAAAAAVLFSRSGRW